MVFVSDALRFDDALYQGEIDIEIGDFFHPSSKPGQPAISPPHEYESVLDNDVPEITPREHLASLAKPFQADGKLAKLRASLDLVGVEGSWE
jgi:hypothetical protein